MLYTGRMAGLFYDQKGGGANFLCLPNNPEYHTLNTNSPPHYSHIYGTEYEYPIAGSHDHNVYRVLFAMLQQELLKWWFLPGPAALQTGQESTTAI